MKRSSQVSKVASRAFRPSLISRMAAAALLCHCLACNSAEEWRAEADDEAYALVAARRAELRLDPRFTIEPMSRDLRDKLAAGGEAPLLTLPATLAIAAECSREVQTRKERLYLAALDVTLDRWRFHAQKGMSLAAFLDGEDEEAVEARGDAALSISKLFGDGTSVVAEAGFDVARSLVSSDGWNPASSLSLSITRPLLAGGGEAIVREPLTQSERDLVYEARSFERFRRTFAFDTASRWYRLLQSRNEVENQRVNVANLEQLSQRNRALAEAGRLSEIEFGQARQNELRSKNQLLAAEERYERELDQFALFLGLPVGARLEPDAQGLVDLEASGTGSLALSEAQAIALALADRYDHANTLGEVEDAARRVMVAEDALLASLSVVGDLAATSESGEPFKYGDGSLGWSAGFTFAAPWEKLPQRNNARAAVVSWESAKRAAEASEDEIRAEVRESLRAVRTSEESWSIQQNAAELAKQRVESTRLLLDAGRADTRDLLEAEESLLSARNAATGALVDWVLARMSAYLDMERLVVEEDGIVLLEPPASLAGRPRQGSSG